jgi:LuxR family maltose regulon positive regulatory protein
MDYLVEEVLHQQPAGIQAFLLRTSILDRFCAPLCESLLENGESRVENSQQFSTTLDSPFSTLQSPLSILEYLERANLFIVPLDNERRWYRYHHLFADLLRQRLHQSLASSTGDAQSRLNELHLRASRWYEDNGLAIEAFRHAAAAHDIDRAERLIQGKGLPMHYRGAVIVILDWLASLPPAVLDARPSLWWRYGSLLLVTGHTTGVEEKLQAAENALQPQLQGAEPDGETRNLVGQIASARSVLALTRYQPETMIAQSRRALEYLAPDSGVSRSTALWTQGYAYLLLGDRAASRRALTEAIALSQVSGNIFTTILATIGLGNVQEAENQLAPAAETYRRVLQWAGDQPLQIIHEAHLGLARVLYEWNDLEAAGQHGRQSLLLARQYDRVIDRFVMCEVFLARLQLAQGDLAGAAAILAQAGQSARQGNFVYRIPEVAAGQVLILLRQGDLPAAARLAQAHDLPHSQARVHLAQGDPSEALAALEPLRRQAEARDWPDERLKVLVLQSLALHALGEPEQAVQALGEALALAEPAGFIRIFVDEGEPMRSLIMHFRSRIEKQSRGQDGMLIDYGERLLAAFPQPAAILQSEISNQQSTMFEPLSPRELEVLHLIAQGLSNQEISERLFLALDTVKGHNRKIFGKLQVQRRTEAVARARELGLV